MSEPVRVLLVRHGLTDWNETRRYQGHRDTSLNDRGVWQAEQVARVLSGEEVHMLVSSDLQRARQTAIPIASALGIPVRHDPRLREINFGQWEGLTYDEMMAADARLCRLWSDDPLHHAPPGGETVLAAAGRIVAVGTEVAGKIEGGTFLLVAHGGTLKLLLCHLLGVPYRAYWQFPFSQTAITEVHLYPAGTMLVRHNDTSHLRVGVPA